MNSRSLYLHAKRVMAAVESAICALDDAEVLVESLTNLGRRHQPWSVREEHFKVKQANFHYLQRDLIKLWKKCFLKPSSSQLEISFLLTISHTFPFMLVLRTWWFIRFRLCFITVTLGKKLSKIAFPLRRNPPGLRAVIGQSYVPKLFKPFCKLLYYCFKYLIKRNLF